MTRPVFVVAAERAGDPVVVLDGPEGRHAATVRRLGPGEEVDLVDGAGLRLTGVVVAAGHGVLTVEVRTRVAEPPRRPALVIVQALATNQRDDSAVEAMTEVGVDVIVPWAASRSVAQWSGLRGERSLERWRSTAREAGKQSRRARFPDVRPLATTAEVARLVGAAALGVVLHEAAHAPLVDVPFPAGDEGEVVVVVGPEGGITDEELRVFGGHGALACRLGDTVLRTSTAGVAALAVLLARSGRWS